MAGSCKLLAGIDMRCFADYLENPREMEAINDVLFSENWARFKMKNVGRFLNFFP